jgi:bifunctional UDP-N-acetylglucosamine pyrophosphorylase/glucosamine-1-phosphate N-acetyltransferase
MGSGADIDMADRPLAVVVLAAGKGTRMRSDLPKVLHKIAGRPMVGHVIAVAEGLGADPIIVVIAPGMDDVAKAVAPHVTAVQSEQRGTGDAVKAARPQLSGFDGDVLILVGDGPMIDTRTLADMRRAHNDAAVTVLAIRVPGDSAYGRLIVGADGMLERIVEAKDATAEQRKVDLCSSGFFLVDSRHLFDLLDKVGTENAQGEYYLPDIVGVARQAGLVCRAFEARLDEPLGVNSRSELAQAEASIQTRLRKRAMDNGATLIDPQTVWLSFDTKLGRDVTIGPNVFFGPGVTVGDHVEIRSFCHIEQAEIADGAIIGPFARLRPGASIGEGAHIGNFVEIKNARIDWGAKANHLAYVGDADVGAKANIGAGVITCNYDGVNKHRTTIGAGAFVGSDATLVAPVTIGAGAFVAAGSTITQDVPDDALAVARGRQMVKLGWAGRFFHKSRDGKGKD